MKIGLTGNPFVDAGLGVIASLAELDDVNELKLSHLKSVYDNGDQLIRWNSRLKSFTQIFGTNNPLFQTAYGFKKGNGPSEINKAIYRSTLEGLLSEISKSEGGPRCWACGTPSDFDFAMVCKKAVEDNGKKAPEGKWVGRDWFPLAGSLGSDAQALPAASVPPHICPTCLYAIHYLPLGLILLDGRLAVFQCTSPDFLYEFIQNIVKYNKGLIQAGNYETLGKKEGGSKALVTRFLDYFGQLKKEPKGTVLYVWRFSNSGTSPECSIEEIPNSALTFLWDAIQEGLRRNIESLIKSEGKNPRYSLFRCILEKRDYLNLYPKGKRKGASPKLFTLYQTHICNHSPKALQIAYKLAKETSAQISEKELKRIQRSEAFKEKKVRNQFRASMIKMAENGELTLEDYIDLFPTEEGKGITVGWDGWNLIRFYLYHTNEDDEPKWIDPIIVKSDKSPIFYYAGVIYNHYVTERGKEHFQEEVLGQMKRSKLGVQWLRSQFIQLAELEDGFTYRHWSNLCKLYDGRIFVSELLFQMRLLWVLWIYENRASVNLSPPIYGESTDELPNRVKTLIEVLFADYIEGRGLDRFHQDILLRLRRREIGLFWFKERLTKQTFEDIHPLTEDKWEEFLVDDEGRSIKAERLFQLHLALANIYRAKRFNEQIKEVTK